MKATNAATVEAVKSGRTNIGPFNVGRAVRMWKASKLSAYETMEGYSTWRIVQITPEGDEVSSPWILSTPPVGKDMLYQEAN